VLNILLSFSTPLKVSLLFKLLIYLRLGIWYSSCAIVANTERKVMHCNPFSGHQQKMYKLHDSPHILLLLLLAIHFDHLASVIFIYYSVLVSNLKIKIFFVLIRFWFYRKTTYYFH